MKARVLVVDDDAPTRRVLRFLLEDEGYEVDDCADGDEALRCLDARDYEALVTDYIMPGVTGMDLVAHAHARCAAIRCVVVSGYEAPADADPSAVWIAKPIDIDALVSAVRAAPGVSRHGPG